MQSAARSQQRMDIDPPIGRDGRNVVGKVALFAAQNHGAYFPLALGCDLAGADRAVAGGYLRRKRGDRFMVALTAKGRAYLDRMMRVE